MGLFDDVGNKISNTFNSSANHLGVGGGNQTTLDNIGKAYGTYVGTATGGIVGGIAANKGISDLTNNPTPPSPPSQDPTLASVKAQQVADAKSFRQNLGSTQQDLYGGAYKNERQNLASNIMAARNNANSRGLLNSGLEQGNELTMRNSSTANLAQARTDINNSTEDAARQLEANAVQSGVQQQQSLASIQDATMQQALVNMTARRQALTGVGQGVGSIAGAYAARPMPGSTTSYGVNQPTYYGT